MWLEWHLGSILQISVSDKNFLDKFSSLNFGQISTQKGINKIIYVLRIIILNF
jgi:hypothetical protein